MAEQKILKDPTRPLDFAPLVPVVQEISIEQEGGQLNLEGIIVSENNRFAIINQKILSVGDLIEHAKIISIDQDQVVLSKSIKKKEKNGEKKEEKKIVLSIHKNSIKETSK